MTTDDTRLTSLLGRWEGGDGQALDQLLPLVYQELKQLAAAQFRRERSDHTLQPTALVHETYVKLIGGNPGNLDQRSHFFALAAKAMRQVMVDHARKKGARKRGGDQSRVPFTEALGKAAPGSLTSRLDTIALDQVLHELVEIRPRAAHVVELRYFGGLTVDEVAAILKVTPKTVARDWNVARLWLLARLEGTA